MGLSPGSGSDSGEPRRAARPRDLVVALAVVVVAAAYFTQGIALSGGWEQGWVDEGILVYQSWRVAEGALPYRDVHHVYGPSAFFLPAAAIELLGPDVRSVRVSVAAVKVLIALAVYLLARRVAGALVAGAAAGLFIAVWGEPMWVFGTAYAGHAAMACALWGLVLLGALPDRPSVGAFLGGLCFGAAATFKLGAGLLPFLALVLFLIDEHDGATPAGARRSVAAGVRLAALAAVLGLALVYTSAGAVTDVPGLMSTAAVLAPFAACTIAVGAREVAYRVEAPALWRGLTRVMLAGLGAALPLAGYVAFFAAHGAAASLVHDVIALPQRLRWFMPMRPPSLPALAVAGAATSALMAASAPHPRVARAARAGAIVLGAIAAMLVLRAHDDSWWSAPVAPWRGTAYDIVYYLPFVTVAAAMPLLLERPRIASAPLRLYLLFAAANLVLLYPSADVWHGLLALPAFLPLLSGELSSAAGRAEPSDHAAPGRLPAGLGAALLLALALPFVLDLIVVRRAWSGVPLERASGISHPHPKFGDAAALVRWLRSDPVRGRSIFVLSGEQMIYFLAARVSPVEDAEYTVHMLAVDAATAGDAAELTDEHRMLRRLKRTPPLVVDYVGSPVGPRLRQAFRRIDRYLQTHCPPHTTFGGYQVRECAPSPRREPAAAQPRPALRSLGDGPDAW